MAALGAGIAAAPEARNRLRLALLDAKRGEVFAALTAADGRVVWEECVIAPDRLGLRLAELDQAPICAGDGALRFSAQLLEFGAEVLGSGHPAHIVHARHICELGRTVSAGPPDSIEPTYLRRPDAELWIERDTA